MDDGELLAGGNASGAVRRVGDTVRKPWLETSPQVARYLHHLAAHGIDVPQVRGRDEQGRGVVDFVPGRMAIETAPLPVDRVRRVGGLLPSPDDLPGQVLVCHNDVATWNLVLDGQRMVLIDWDGAGPSTRPWDLAYAAISFAHTVPDAGVGQCATRLSALADGCGADDRMRRLLPPTMTRRARAMWRHLADARATGWQPWARMHDEGHGEHWLRTARFVEEHQDAWHDALRAG